LQVERNVAICEKWWLAEYFEKYLNAMNNTGKFYRRPLAGQPIRHGTQAIGINKLKTMMKCICDRAGLIGTYSINDSFFSK
jgi:hypothetical protein